MYRPLIAYLLLILVPSAVLGWLAWRASGQDYAAQTAQESAHARDEATVLAHRVETALSDRRQHAKRLVVSTLSDADSSGLLEAAVAFAADGKWLGYTIAARRAGREKRSTEQRELAADLNAQVHAEDARLYELARRGGEAYEFVHRDPHRALDAYAFYLPRLRAPHLRDQLRFAIARTALAASRADLGAPILRQLAAGDGAREGAASLPGRSIPVAGGTRVPLDLAAALRLAELEKKQSAHDAHAAPPAAYDGERLARAALRRRARGLSTPLLALLVSRLPTPDPDLARYVDHRRQLEELVARHASILSHHDAVLDGDDLLVAIDGQEIERPNPQLAATTRGIVRVPAALPRLQASSGLIVGIVRSGSDTPDAKVFDVRPTNTAATKSTSVRLPVAIRDGGRPVCYVVVEDATLPKRLATLRERRDVQRTAVGLLVLLSLAGGAVLVVYLGRERRLARLRARLLANVSHELKTPTTSVRLFSEMLTKEKLDREQTRRFASLLHNESLRLSRIIENVLEFARGGKRRDVELEEVDVYELAKRLIDSFEYRASELGVRLEFSGEAPRREDFSVQANGAAVERILYNLIDNAIKYRASDDPYALVHFSCDADAALVTVTDNGVGITPRDRKRVFEEFYRARFDDYAVQGTGLGLSIARSLARQMGGELSLIATSTKGSTFVLRLPAIESRTGHAATELETPKKRGVHPIAQEKDSITPADAASKLDSTAPDAAKSTTRREATDSSNRGGRHAG